MSVQSQGGKKEGRGAEAFARVSGLVETQEQTKYAIPILDKYVKAKLKSGGQDGVGRKLDLVQKVARSLRSFLSLASPELMVAHKRLVYLSRL